MMKNNINPENIFNRQIILEVRFNHKLEIADKRGIIARNIQDLKILSNFAYAFGEKGVRLTDSSEIDEIRNTFFCEINRFAHISTRINSISEFYKNFDTAYNSFVSIVDDVDITRIGCRILGTYKSNSKKFEAVKNSFSQIFNDKYFMEEYPVNDLLLKVVYQNGSYSIGPVDKDDPFLIRNFNFIGRENKIGVAIDVDNFMLADFKDKKLDANKIMDVLTASLAVEKSLYEKLKDF